MPLQIVRNDITKMKVDAIVNAANSSLLGGGGVDGCIHRAAGPELLAECKTLGGCETGSAKITKGYKLPCKYVIHAVGPRWRDGKHGEREKLISCYRTSLALAKENGCETVALPLISSGIYGYPKDQALRIAIDTISEFLLENDMTVYIVIFDRKAYQISGKLYADIAEYIDDNYVDEHSDDYSARLRRLNALRDMEPVCEASVCEEADEAIEPTRKGVSLIIDIQNSIKAQESKGYEHWAKINNLKEAAKTLNYLTENNLLQYADLEKKAEDIHSSYTTDRSEGSKKTKTSFQIKAPEGIFIKREKDISVIPS